VPAFRKLSDVGLWRPEHRVKFNSGSLMKDNANKEIPYFGILWCGVCSFVVTYIRLKTKTFNVNGNKEYVSSGAYTQAAKLSHAPDVSSLSPRMG
jgi:hypothetical protein